jgi:hypothetical protein
MKNNALLGDQGVLIAGIVCGILSYASVELLHGPLSWFPGAEPSGTYLPGLLFGLLVFSPQIRATSNQPLRRVGAVVASTVLYYLAIQVGVFFALGLNFPSSLAGTAAALLGALAIGVTAHWLVPMSVSRDAWRKLAIFGALGGAVLGIPTGGGTPKIVEIAVVALGLTIWQAGVGYSLFRQSSSSK